MAGEKEQREALEKLRLEFRAKLNSVDLDSPEYFSFIQQTMDDWRSASVEIAKSYRSDVPNTECHYAALTGIGIQNQTWNKSGNSEFPSKGDRVDFFAFGAEAVSLWTHKDDDYTVLLVEVDPANFATSLWRTLASSMSVAIALSSMQEHAQTLDYCWIYRFRSDLSIHEQELLNGDASCLLSDRILETVEDWFQRSRILELLKRDESFFVASQLLRDSFEIIGFA